MDIYFQLFDISPPTPLSTPSLEPENKITMDIPWVNNAQKFYDNFKESSM